MDIKLNKHLSPDNRLFFLQKNNNVNNSVHCSYVFFLPGLFLKQLFSPEIPYSTRNSHNNETKLVKD